MSNYEDIVRDSEMSQEEWDDLVFQDNVVEATSDIYYKGKSKIHGIGLFAKKNLCAGEFIGLFTLHRKYRTPLSRWANHAEDHNALMCNSDDDTFKDIIVIACKDIDKDSEILLNYAHVL